MANYAPTTWATGDTISATKLNNVENGLNNLTIAGTANQVLVNGATTAINNAAITLTLPQSIATGSSPTFTGLTISGTAVDIGGIAGSFSQLANVTGNSAAATTNNLLLQNKATQAENVGVALRFAGASDWIAGIDALFNASLGGYLKITTQSGGNLLERLRIDALGNIVPGTAALATTATDGFTYIQTCAGAPTGVPTAYTGRIAMIFDTSNNNLYVYDSGWLKVAMAA